MPQKPYKLTNYEETIPVVEEYENIFRFQKKISLNFAYRQAAIFKKLNESKKFVQVIKEIWVRQVPETEKVFFITDSKTIKEKCEESV